MFDEVDETLRRLLVREIPIRSNEVEIAFDQPKREWSARLNRPTLNLFMHDLRENIDLRSSYQHHGRPNPNGKTITLPRPTHRYDLHYIVTSWAAEPDDEHRLLARALLAFLRVPELIDDDLYGSFRYSQPAPVQLRVSQYESHLTPLDIWGVLDNEMRPALMLSVTLSLDPHAPIEIPVVSTRELRMGEVSGLTYRRQQGDGPVRFLGRPRNIAEENAEDPKRGFVEMPREYWTIGGRIGGAEGALVRLQVAETGQDVPLAADGRFVIGNLQRGTYTLLIISDGEERRQTIDVPSEDYLIEV